MAVKDAFQKLGILLYKGLLLRKRHYIVTVFEIIFPVLLASIPAILQSEEETLNAASKEKPKWENDTVHKPFDPFSSGPTFSHNCIFAYAPPSKFTDMLMNDSLQFWKDNHLQVVTDTKAFENKEVLEDYCVSKQGTDKEAFIIGTIFNGMSSSQESLPSNLDYTIRYSSPYMPQFYTDSKYQYSHVGKDYDFWYSISVYATATYFLSWQAAIEKTFIEKKMEEENIVEYQLSMQEFPFPGHKEKTLGTVWKKPIMPTMIIYGFIVFVINITRRIIEEKSNGSKELMKMMGMTDLIYWFSSFLNYFSVGVVIALIITIVYKSPLKNGVIVLENSNFLILFIIFVLFVANLTLFSLALTTFFNTAVFGITVMIIVYNGAFSLLTSFVFPFNIDQTQITYAPLSFFLKFCICLLPPGSVLTIFEIILGYEEGGDGVQWSNLYNTDVAFNFSVHWLMISMLFSCFLYAVLIWYIDAVWPWQYGVPKPFYFLFTKSYWSGYEEKDDNEILLSPNEERKNEEYFEDDPVGISPGVVIRNLSKVRLTELYDTGDVDDIWFGRINVVFGDLLQLPSVFRTGFQIKVAVENVSLNIYDSEITALLGHNGAGKTTIINILTGLFLPTSGTASINGWNIFSQTSKARQSLGVCPQHNILYDTLSVEEHLKIYAALKGIKWNLLNEEVNRILKMVHLTEKRTELAKNLSGGMKRKLSLGIAVVGGSKILFLDEPTSGMDVETRRKVWDTLLEMRPNHCIILTTHYMEEADVLGDRIAIMAHGKVQCCGSSLFLKKKFGTGYHLHLVKNKNFNMDAVQDVLSKFFPAADLVNDYEGEVTFNLMTNNTSNFGLFFEELEEKKDKHGINSCGLTVTTMDDVFLKVASLTDDVKHKEGVDSSHDESAEALEMKDIYVEESNQFGRSKNFFNQFCGLFLKRMAYSKRNWSIITSQLILPFLIICICLSIINATTFKSFESESPLQLDVKKVYGETDGFYHNEDINPPKSVKLIITEIQKVFKENNIDAKSVDDPQAYVLKYGREELVDYLKKFIVGASAGSHGNTVNLKAWFNGFPYHATPMALLMMDNAILKSINKSGSIKLTNHPFPRSKTYIEDESHTAERLLANIFLPLAFSFLSASFVMVPIHEKITKAKLLQMMTGISPATYWLALFAWDFLISIIVSILLIIPFAIFTHYAFFSPHSEAIGTAILLMILYGWASIPFYYLFTLIFKKPNTGYSVVNVVCVLTGTATTPIFSTLSRLPPVKNKYTIKVFAWLLKLFPSYALGSGFGNLFSISFANAFCDGVDPKDLNVYCADNPSPSNILFKCCKAVCGSKCLKKTRLITMEIKACGPDILFLFIDGVFYFCLLLLLESSFLKYVFYCACQQLRKRWRKINTNLVDLSDDSDVLHEEERINANYEQMSHNDALISLNLTKIFGNITAVNGLTFGIHKRECFGLLGVNGAGKTTTFRMLTGDCFPTSGNAYINSYSVIENLKKFQCHLGYCPQFDALIDRLTAREMITLFARLRGLSGASMIRYVNAMIKMTDLTQYADKPSMVYSGGNKRKLCIALALIGAPPVILLDEPTAGVDPVSRRKIWKILSLARIHSGASVILTTHSMEECEALCSRLAIMVNGQFRCLGSIQHLKSKFGQGYTLIIKLKKEEQSIPQSMIAVKAYIDTNLAGANLKDDHQGMVQYHVVDPSHTLSSLFKFMEDMQKKYNLEDYVISDTSLEQIFLIFAQSQRIVVAQ